MLLLVVAERESTRGAFNSELCGRDSCGHEPALPAKTPPFKCVCAASCFLRVRFRQRNIFIFLNLKQLANWRWRKMHREGPNVEPNSRRDLLWLQPLAREDSLQGFEQG